MRVLILIGLAGAHVGCLSGDCTESRLRTFEVALPTDAAMQFRIDRCQLDPETCVDICELAMERVQFFAPVDHCKVTFEETRLVALASYEVPSDRGTCAFQTGDDVAPPPNGGPR